MTMTAAGSARGAPPGLTDVGATGAWTLPVDDGQAVTTFPGRLLGYADSRRGQHELEGASRNRLGAVHDVVDGQPYARAGQRCGACRWFEVRIFRGGRGCRRVNRCEHAGEFVIHYTGATVVPGEVHRSRVAYADGGHALIEQATSRNLEQNRVFITPPMARALAMAANHDPDVEHAWVNRAVE